jgi:hypothetical protein
MEVYNLSTEEITFLVRLRQLDHDYKQSVFRLVESLSEQPSPAAVLGGNVIPLRKGGDYVQR